MIDLQLVRLTIFGIDERRVVEFSPGLNVVVGPYGSGKTSLLELVKFGLGGSARLSEAVEAGVSSVVVEVALRGAVHSFQRDVGSPRVAVSHRGEPVATLHATSSTARGAILASQFLLKSLGIPTMQVRRSRTGSSAAREPISFWDIYRYVYVSQNDMGQSIAGHSDSQLDRKRRRAFELMFGLLDPRAAELETAEVDLRVKIDSENKRVGDVSAFLEATGVPSRGRALELLRAAESERAAAIAALNELRTSTRGRDVGLRPKQDELGGLLARRSELEDAAAGLRASLASRRRLGAQVALDIEALQRGATAVDVLGPIDFTQCPRCLQRIEAERIAGSQCLLCMQNVEASDADPAQREREIQRLRDLQDEIRDLLLDDEQAARLVDRELGEIRRAISSAEDDLHSRTTGYVAPLFEEISDLSRSIAQSEAQVDRLNFMLSQWSEKAALQARVDDLRRQLDQLSADLEEERARLDHRRALVVELSETFDEIVQELELAWYTTARVDLTSYLPVIGTANFLSLSGGQRTVVSVAYHLALLTIGLVHASDVRVPSLLIFDTPSKYLGGKDAGQVARNLRRVSAIVSAYDRPVQVIVADNDPPPQGVEVARTIELTYDDPLVPGLEHPGPDAVTPIHAAYDDTIED